MKKNYIFTMCALLGLGTLSAQNNMPLKQKEQKKKHLATGDVQSKPVITNDHHQKAPGDIAWSSDFSTPANWTANGPAAAPSGPDYGWTIQTSPDTWAFGSAFNSSSGGNFAHFENGDPTASPATQHQGGPFTYEFANTIDLSGVPAPQISIEQYGAIFFEKQEVQISTDGGSTWTTVLDNSDEEAYTANSGGPYANPYNKSASIGSVISANPSNVTVRLFWDGDQNGPNTSYVSYGWFVDDIQITEGYPNNIKMNSFNYASTNLGLRYSQMPMNHITDMGFGSRLENIGSADQTNTALEIEVSGAGTYTGSSTSPVTLNSYMIDSLTVESFTASTVGTYNVLGYPSSDNTLTSNNNDTANASFEVTQNTYATDYGGANGGFTSWLNGTGSQSIGNFYETTSSDELYAIDVGIAGSNNIDSVKNKIFFAEVYRFNATTSSYDFVTTQDKVLDTVDLIGQIVTLKLPSTVSVSAGEEYLVVAGSFSGDIGITMTGKAIDGTVAGYDNSTLNGLASPNYPIVRMNFDESLAIENEESRSFSIGQNVPNPFNENAYINYSLNESKDVQFTITDMSGKTIMNVDKGTQSSGEHRINLNGSDYAQGVYFYTFTVGNQKVTKKMVVTQ